MMARSIFCVVLAFLTLFSQPLAHAASLNQNQPAWYYVDPTSLPPTLLPPPPLPQSTEGQEQIHAVIKSQKHITFSDVRAMHDEQHVRLELMTQILGPDFTAEQKPKLFKLLNHVMADTRTISETDKNFWHTKRPYLVNHAVKLMIDPIDESPAYPSGHTCFARVVAEVLGLVYPNRLIDLRVRANDIAWHRVEAGVHYPVDLEGGRSLAMLIIGSLMQNDTFLDDVAEARQEAGFPN